MSAHPIVSHEQWLTERTRFLEREKEFTRLRDELSAARRALPWERIEKPYTFRSEQGLVSLADLFGKRSQLIVYHFMFDPNWEVGCRGCSFWADSFNGIVPHLNQRDVTLVAVSRAPLPKLREQAQRFGWSFPWVSSADSDFNYDLGVSFTPGASQGGTATYNYRPHTGTQSDLPGISAFIRTAGEIYHTYSAYARGLDMLNTAYQILDLAPKGRDEEGLPFPMAWVRHRIAYES